MIQNQLLGKATLGKQMKPINSHSHFPLLLEKPVSTQESCHVLQHEFSNGNETNGQNLSLAAICESFSIDFYWAKISSRAVKLLFHYIISSGLDGCGTVSFQNNKHEQIR